MKPSLILCTWLANCCLPPQVNTHYSTQLLTLSATIAGGRYGREHIERSRESSKLHTKLKYFLQSPSILFQVIVVQPEMQLFSCRVYFNTSDRRVYGHTYIQANFQALVRTCTALPCVHTPSYGLSRPLIGMLLCTHQLPFRDPWLPPVFYAHIVVPTAQRQQFNRGNTNEQARHIRWKMAPGTALLYASVEF